MTDDVIDSGSEFDDFPFHEGVFFHVNIAFYIIDYFGIEDVSFFISEIFNDLHNLVSSKRSVKHGATLYFGGVIQLRNDIFHNVFAIERKRMTAIGIGIKYQVSCRNVWRALKAVGFSGLQ